jgi:alkylation response protein AidB-like acyl-CoA dehydrogenase
MVILHQQENCLEEDYRFWQPLGMKASVSCRFDFTGVGFDRTQMLGKAHDYVKEPDFTGGAVRFAAVQLGGAEAAIRATIGHLQKWKRAGAPDQVRRLGQLSILQETGRLWLRGAAQAMDDKKGNPSAYMHYANMFRTATRRICEEVLELCGLCVGLQGMMAPHPLERITRDLMVYLKQPGPDRTLSQVGEYFNVNYKQGE